MDWMEFVFKWVSKFNKDIGGMGGHCTERAPGRTLQIFVLSSVLLPLKIVARNFIEEASLGAE
jgi:hypothetical protein